MSKGEQLMDEELQKAYPRVVKSIHAYGHKIFFEYLISSKSHPDLLNQIDKVILLDRLDAEAQFRSLKKARQSGVWSSNKLSGAEDQLVEYSDDEFNSYKHSLMTNRKKALELVDEKEVLKITYEDLVNKKNQTLKRVQRFLEVKPITLKSLLRKQS